MEVKFIEPKQDLINFIACHMRQADVDEVWAASHHTPIDALMNGLVMSDYSVVVTVNDEPCVILGLAIRDILSGVGIPWMLSTGFALKYKRNFITQVPSVINEMLSICPSLYNYVHVNNKISISWLKRIGFTFDEPKPHGYDNELFHRFYMRVN